MITTHHRFQTETLPTHLHGCGSAIFTVASLLCAFASSISLLIGGRALAGLGAALLLPASLAIIRVVWYDPPRGTWAGFGHLRFNRFIQPQLCHPSGDARMRAECLKLSHVLQLLQNSQITACYASNGGWCKQNTVGDF